MPNVRQDIPSHNSLVNMASTKVASSTFVVSLLAMVQISFGRIEIATILPISNCKSSTKCLLTANPLKLSPLNMACQVMVCFVTGFVPIETMDMLS